MAYLQRYDKICYFSYNRIHSRQIGFHMHHRSMIAYTCLFLCYYDYLVICSQILKCDWVPKEISGQTNDYVDSLVEQYRQLDRAV